MVKADCNTPAIDALFAADPYGYNGEERHGALLTAMNEAYRHHFANCAAFTRFCRRRGFEATTTFTHFEDFPYLPTQAFKEFPDLLCSTSEGQIRTRLQSSATSGRASTVQIDAITARRQVLALSAVIAATLGGKRRPFIICDVDPTQEQSTSLGARMAAVRGFLTLAREAHYIMRTRHDGSLEVVPEKLQAALNAARAQNEPFVVFGFTYVLYADIMEPLLKLDACPESLASIVHIGGWKKLEDRKVSRERFEEVAHHVFGAAPANVIDYYGFTEQMGVVYPASSDAVRTVPVFAEVIVRDPDTHAPLPPGKPGLLQFLTPLPNSYPGISVITDDVGMILENVDPRHPAGTHFMVLGRAKNAEVRGCGDVMADKMVSRKGPDIATSNEPPRLLFYKEPFVSITDPLKAIRLEELPLADMQMLCKDLLEGRKALDAYSYDELAVLVAAASRRWTMPTAGLDMLRQHGLQFLAAWCRPDHLSRLGDEALKGARGHVDAFRSAGVGGRQIRAYPRGLVTHWLSGNVPLLGMLALTQAILTRNANILKSASNFSSALPVLLNAFRGLEVASPSGRTLRGDDLLKSVAVVYYPKDAIAPAEQMSMAADVRVAWGGREAVEAIGRLPRRYDAEDVMFGPKLSFMVVGREWLKDERSLKKIARRAATDSSVFDQYACASPHTIFVERGGTFSPHQFGERLAREMAGAAVRIPKMATDAGTAAAITAARLRYEFSGELWTSSGTTWSVFYDESPELTLAQPCYSRTVTVRAVDDILAVADLANADIQTVGIAMEGVRRQEFADRAAKNGAYRFPEVGRMTEFDSVWDGLYMMDRFVKWISLGGPVT